MSGNSQTYTYKFVGPDGGSDFVSATLDFESGYTALTAFIQRDRSYRRGFYLDRP
jgi:hypothetical protein